MTADWGKNYRFFNDIYIGKHCGEYYFDRQPSAYLSTKIVFGFHRGYNNITKKHKKYRYKYIIEKLWFRILNDCEMFVQ